MKPFDIMATGVKRQNYSWKPGTTSVVNSENRKSISIGPLIKGDGKTPNPWFYEILETVGWHGADQWVNGQNITWTSGCLGSFPDPSVDIRVVNGSSLRSRSLAETDSVALTRLYEAIRGELDLGVSAAQLVCEESLLRSSIRALNEVKKLTPRSIVKAIAAGRLGYVYALKPTCEDLYQAISLMGDHLVENVVRRIKVTARVQPSLDVLDTLPTGYIRHEGIFVSYRTKYLATFRVDPGTWQDVARWSSLNPVSFAWELMPASFIVDWFYNVGDYVRNMESAIIYRNMFDKVVKTQSVFVQYVSQNWYNSTYQGYGCSGGYSGAVTRKGMTRTVSSTAPFPDPPRFSCDLGSSRLLNAAALLTNLLAKERPPRNFHSL